MKKIKVLSCLILGVVMSACSNDNSSINKGTSQNNLPISETDSKLTTSGFSQLVTPDNIFFDKNSNTLEWGIVDHASSYRLKIDSKERETQNNYFDISTMELSNNEVHTAKVKAIGSNDYLSSDYSDEIQFTLNDSSTTTNDDSNLMDNFGQKMSLNAYNAVPNNELTLKNSINLNDNYYLWYFDLGNVYRTPVYSSSATKFQYNIEAEFTFSELHSTEFRDNISNVQKTIDTHSYTGGFEISLAKEDSFQTSFSMGFEISASSTISFEASGDQHWTDNWGSETTHSENIENGYIDQYGQETKMHIAFDEKNGFKKSNWYRIAFYEAVRTYGVLVYDIKNNTYSYAFSEFLLPGQKQLIIEETSDPNGIFDYNLEKKLTFDLDTAVEIALNNIPENKAPVIQNEEFLDNNKIVSFLSPANILKFDFSSLQKEGLKKFSWHETWYNNGILTIHQTIKYNQIYEVQIIGGYMLKDENYDSEGMSKLFKGFSIVFDKNWDRSIVLTLKNIGIEAANDMPVISLEEGNKQNICINFDGNVELKANTTSKPAIQANDLTLKGSLADIKGKDSNSVNSNGGTAINCNQFIMEDAEVSITGGNGFTSNEFNKNGTSGGSAIICSNLIIRNSTLNCAGGSGGSGHIGRAATAQHVHDEINGTNGGNGANAITCTTATLHSSSISLSGGNGGNGGNGANGYTATGASCNGTSGGAAGSGGHGIKLKSEPEIIDSYLYYTNGVHGTGGEAGKKGSSWGPFDRGLDGSPGKDGKDGMKVYIG